jgi:hypothetical protein
MSVSTISSSFTGQRALQQQQQQQSFVHDIYNGTTITEYPLVPNLILDTTTTTGATTGKSNPSGGISIFKVTKVRF